MSKVPVAFNNPKHGVQVSSEAHWNKLIVNEDTVKTELHIASM